MRLSSLKFIGGTEYSQGWMNCWTLWILRAKFIYPVLALMTRHDRDREALDSFPFASLACTLHITYLGQLVTIILDPEISLPAFNHISRPMLDLPSVADKKPVFLPEFPSHF